MRFSLAATLLALVFLFVLKSQASNCDKIMNEDPQINREVKFDASGKLKINSSNQDILSQEVNSDRQSITFRNNYKKEGTTYMRQGKLVSDKDNAYTRVVRYFENTSDKLPSATYKLVGTGNSCIISQIVKQDFIDYDHALCKKLLPLAKNFNNEKLDKCSDIIGKALVEINARDAQKELNGPSIIFNQSTQADRNDDLRVFQTVAFLKTCREFFPSEASQTSSSAGSSSRSNSAK